MKKLMCGVLIVVMMLSLVACGNKLSGTYKTEEKLGCGISYVFDGKNVTRQLKAFGKTVSAEGTYEIEDGKITLNWEEDSSGLTEIISGIEKALGLEGLSDAMKSGTYEFEKTDDGIKIGTLELKRA